MLDNFLFKDSNGKKSLTATVFIWGSIVVNFKLIFSGMVVGTVTLSQFSGSEYAMALASLGGIYVVRRNSDKTVTPIKESKE